MKFAHVDQQRMLAFTKRVVAGDAAD